MASSAAKSVQRWIARLVRGACVDQGTEQVFGQSGQVVRIHGIEQQSALGEQEIALVPRFQCGQEVRRVARCPGPGRRRIRFPAWPVRIARTGSTGGSAALATNEGMLRPSTSPGLSGFSARNRSLMPSDDQTTMPTLRGSIRSKSGTYLAIRYFGVVMGTSSTA